MITGKPLIISVYLESAPWLIDLMRNYAFVLDVWRHWEGAVHNSWGV